MCNLYCHLFNCYCCRHIMEHLDGMVAPEENLSDDEVQFRFFKVHDYNNDNQLDGIELIAALTDYHGKGWCSITNAVRSRHRRVTLPVMLCFMQI